MWSDVQRSGIVLDPPVCRPPPPAGPHLKTLKPDVQWREVYTATFNPRADLDSEDELNVTTPSTIQSVGKNSLSKHAALTRLADTTEQNVCNNCFLSNKSFMAFYCSASALGERQVDEIFWLRNT